MGEEGWRAEGRSIRIMAIALAYQDQDVVGRSQSQLAGQAVHLICLGPTN